MIEENGCQVGVKFEGRPPNEELENYVLKIFGYVFVYLFKCKV